MFGIAKLKIVIVAILLVLILIFVGIWYYLAKTTPPPPNVSPPFPSTVKISCPNDVKICPDGASVVRIPPKCEFVECPKRKSEAITKDNLKIYRNEELKVELTYSATKDYPQDHDEPYGYPNGFFNIGVEGQFNTNIDDYVKPDDYTIRKNFGNNPVITPLTIDGQEARMVNLSTPAENPRDDGAWIIIKYPKPIFLKNPTTGEEEAWLFLAIYTTRQFANDIVATIRFLNR